MKNHELGRRYNKKQIAYWLIPLAAFAMVFGYFIAGTASYSLYSLLLAVRNRDVASAHQYMDMDLIVGTAADEAWKAVMAKMEEDRPSEPFARLGQEIGIGLAQLLMPTLKNRITVMVKKGIDDTIMGTGEKDPLEQFRGMSRPRLALIAFSLPLRRTGMVASIKTRDVKWLERAPDVQQTHLLITLQRTTSRRWQITRIEPEGGWASIMKEKAG